MTESKSDTVGTISIVLAALNGLVLVVSVGVSLIVRQKFFALFADFDVQLPKGTVVFLSIPSVLWLAVTIVLLAAIVAKEFITRKWIALCLNLLFVLLAFGYWVVFVITMMVPLLRVVDELR